MIEIDPRLLRHDRRWTTESCYTALRQPYSKSTATLQQFYGSCTAAPQEFSSDLREQLCSSFTVALSSSMTNFVCSVVRHSRMWCPHGIGRDSWVWGESRRLFGPWFPPRSGGWSLHYVDPLVGGKRGGPWVKWINNYCWARLTTSGRFRLGLVHISTTFIENPRAKRWRSQRCRLLSWPLFHDSRLRIHMNSL